jgi:hypothetical protein
VSDLRENAPAFHVALHHSAVGLTVGTGPFDSGKGSPKYGFHADNGTAESAAAGRYTGRIFLKVGCDATESQG